MCFVIFSHGGGRFAIEVPADSPLFAGHFPGRPVLPGICHLAFVERALGGRAVCEIVHLRLRRQVSGAARLELALEGPLADGAVRFVATHGNETVANGTLRLAPAGWLPETLELPQRERTPIGELIPHRLPARLVASTLEVRERGITCLATLPADHPLAAAGRAPAFLALEAGAQAAAVFEALERKSGTGPRIGYLVGLRDARLDLAWLPVDTPFAVSVELIGSAPPLAQYRIEVAGLVSGTVSTFLADEP